MKKREGRNTAYSNFSIVCASSSLHFHKKTPQLLRYFNLFKGRQEKWEENRIYQKGFSTQHVSPNTSQDWKCILSSMSFVTMPASIMERQNHSLKAQIAGHSFPNQIWHENSLFYKRKAFQEVISTFIHFTFTISKQLSQLRGWSVFWKCLLKSI